MRARDHDPAAAPVAQRQRPDDDAQRTDTPGSGGQPGGNQPFPPPEKRPSWQHLAAVLLLLVLWSMLYQSFTTSPVEELSYSQFKEEVRQGRVAEVTFEGDTIHGRYAAQAREGDGTGAEEGPQTPERFVTTKPQVEDPELLDLLESKGVKVGAEPPGGPWWARALISVLPWVLILGLFLYISYRLQKRMTGGEGGGMFGFAKSKAKRFREEHTRVRMDQVAGVENAKGDLKEIIDNLAHPERFEKLGAKIPRGVLLIGPPGTGKTLLARAVAGEADVPFYSISGSEFVEMFVGVGAARVRDMFESAKKEAPCVIFIDEIDAVGRARGAGLGGGHDEREQTLNQILSEMDGFSERENVVVLAATNRPDVLDQALLRPGRFDRKVYLELPDREAREAILKVHARDVALGEDVDLGRVAARTIGFSGADLENLVNEAALLAGRDQREQVDMEMFERARDKLVLGAERERGLEEDERKVVAYHESGHALMAWLLPSADPLDKVTIIPRGRALGATEQVPEEDRYNLSRAYVLDRVGVMLGGRVAEQVVFGEVTSGAESDLDQATRLVRRMVTRWGMSDAVGPVALKQGDDHVFLGQELGQQREFSEATAKLVDDEVRRVIEEAEEQARALLERNRKALDRLAKTLLDEETVSAERLGELLKESGAEVAEAQ